MGVSFLSGGGRGNMRMTAGCFFFFRIGAGSFSAVSMMILAGRFFRLAKYSLLCNLIVLQARPSRNIPRRAQNALHCIEVFM